MRSITAARWMMAFAMLPSGINRGANRRIRHTDPMGKLLAKLGWMVAVTIHEGPSEFAVRCFVVGAETEAEAISAVRSSKGTGIDPQDEIVLHRQLSQSA